MNPLASVDFLLAGTAKPLPAQRSLRAGPFSLIYEAGDLRYLRLGEQEVIRRVYAAVRDQNWDTIPGRLKNEELDEKPDSFRIGYEMEHRAGGIHFVWQAAISGESSGVIRFEIQGKALSSFLRNRIGFCLLHPAQAAGSPCRVVQTNGMVQGDLPRFISPTAPFVEIQSISHQPAPGTWITVDFQGDVFEMEDQRNWLDASYKTFCTPLRLPFPVEIKEGTTVHQIITIRGETQHPPRTARGSGPVEVSLSHQPPGALPALGLGQASHGQPLAPAEIELLHELPLAHLRCDLRLGHDNWADILDRAGTDARALGVPLELALFLPDQPDEPLKNLAGRLAREKVSRIMIFDEAGKLTRAGPVQKARQDLGSLQGTRFGGGTNMYFTELNRFRPPVSSLDFVCFSVNPQVHAFDHSSLVETLETHRAVVESARAFCGDRPIVVSPVTLRPRFNPDAIGQESPPPPGALPPQVDPRQMSLFGAGWTMGSLKYLAEARTESVTYYETTGGRGIMETAAGPAVPEQFPSSPGMIFPVYLFLRSLREFARGQVVPSLSSRPLEVESFILSIPGKMRIWLANFKGATAPVTVRHGGKVVLCRTIDERNLAQLLHDPKARETLDSLPAAGGISELELRPFGQAILDVIP